MIELWGSESSSFLQALHFSYGVGALVSPLIVRPYLLESEFMEGMESEGMLLSTMNGTVSERERMMEQSYTREDVLLKYPCWIVAGFTLIPTILYVLLWRLHPKSNSHPSRLEVKDVVLAEDADPDTIKKHETKKSQLQEIERQRNTTSYQFYKYVSIGLMMLFMPIYYGVELTFGNYLATFAVKSDLRLSKATGADMTSMYWAMFTFFRLSTVFYIDYIGAEMNIIMNTVVIMIANVVLAPLYFGYASVWCLWIGAVLMGMGCSSIWASAFGYLEMYFPVSSRVASFIMVSTAVGDFSIPFVMSQFIKDYPNVFLYITLISSLTMAFIFMLAVIVCRLKLRIKFESNNKKVENT
jgi:tRNA-binding EMAP/Myf-like protein